MVNDGFPINTITFGFIVVFIFIGLSYWQLTRYQEDKQIIDSIDSKENINEIMNSLIYYNINHLTSLPFQ